MNCPLPSVRSKPSASPPVELDAVHRADKVDVDDVAVLAGTVGDVHFAGVAVAESVEFLVDVGILYSIRKLFDFHTFVGADFHFRLHGSDRHQRHAFIGKVVHGKFGIAHGRELLFFLVENLPVVLGEEHVERVLEKHAFAVCVLDDVAGRLALAETVDGKSALGL